MSFCVDLQRAEALIAAMDQAGIVRRFEAAGQGQVFRFWKKLNIADREALASQAAEVDLEELGRLLAGEGEEGSGGLESLEPAPYVPLPAERGKALEWAEARERGEALLRAGKVAAFTVAGGQGTRLGFDGPKGTFPVTPVRGKSLFQVFAEKIRAGEKRYGATIPWLIMTSHANHEATLAFFENNAFFGMDRESVFFFRQGRMPVVDFDGKILLESPSRIAMSPDGHGGALRAMVRTGVLEKLRRRGIEVISYFQVDNPLVRVIDPYFIGFHALSGSEMSSKMLPKAHPREKIGVFCRRDGKTLVVEYSDLPESMARAEDDQGRLRFLAGSIAIHLLDLEFVQRVAGGGGGELPFHRARKKVSHVDASGKPVAPVEPNAIKFEMFVFDALPEAANPLVLETSREDEFSPVKNATGDDSADTCVRDQLRQFARWMRAAGIDLPVDENGVPDRKIEVSPLFAVDEESFNESWRRLARKPEIGEGLYLE